VETAFSFNETIYKTTALQVKATHYFLTFSEAKRGSAAGEDE
jgi:hypothetical protein